MGTNLKNYIVHECMTPFTHLPCVIANYITIIRFRGVRGQSDQAILIRLTDLDIPT